MAFEPDVIDSGPNSFVPDQASLKPTVNKPTAPKNNIFQKVLDFLPDGGAFGSPSVADYLPKNPSQEYIDKGQAVTQAMGQGMLGVTPKNPELQAKYPVRSFAGQVAGGVLPYMLPGGALSKFTAIPAAHEIIRQATSTEDLNPAQRAFKVGTAGATGFVTGKLFAASDLLKTIAQRVGAKALAGGTTAAVDSVAQDVESGRDPDLHSAMYGAALNASTIGLLGAAVEIPALRSAVIQEGSRWAGKPVDYATAKKILTSNDVDLNKLAPSLRSAVSEVQKESLIKGLKKTYGVLGEPDKYGTRHLVGRMNIDEAGRAVGDLGIPRPFLIKVLRSNDPQQQIQMLDEQIYSKYKAATGENPPDWRSGQQLPLEKVNPNVAGQLQNLLGFRQNIAGGGNATEVLWNRQVLSQLKPKEYIAAALKENTRNINAEHKAFIKANEPLNRVAEIPAIKEKLDTNTEPMLAEPAVGLQATSSTTEQIPQEAIQQAPTETTTFVPDSNQQTSTFQPDSNNPTPTVSEPEYPQIVSGEEKTQEARDKFASILNQVKEAKSLVIPVAGRSAEGKVLINGVLSDKTMTEEATNFGAKYLGNPYVRRMLVEAKDANLEKMMRTTDPTQEAAQSVFLGEAIKAIDGHETPESIKETRGTAGMEAALLKAKENAQAQLAKNIVEDSATTPVAPRDGANFDVKDNFDVETSVGLITLVPGKYSLVKSGDHYDLNYQGHTVEISDKEFHRLAQAGVLDLDYTDFTKPTGEPKLDEKFGFGGKWTKDESGQLQFFPTKMVFQHTDVERDAPIMLVLDMMNKVPFMSDLRKYFKTSQTIKHEDLELRAFYKVDQDIHDKLWSTKVYEAAVKDLAQVDLHPIHDDVLNNIQQFIASHGNKNWKKKEVYQPMLDQYSELMAEAAEQVMAKSWDPNNYAISKLGNGPHESPSEVDAYIKSVKKWYEFFKIPQQDQIPDAQLTASRSPVFWDLLVHPNVMDNDSLQRAILFYKAQIEMPLLEQQIKWGIFSNTNIWENVVEGYHKHGWVPRGAQQAASQPVFKRAGTSAVSRPVREIRTMQEHKIQGETEGWIPISDFFNNNFDSMVEAMKGIKQAQLHKELTKIPMNRIEYIDPEFIAANAKNPSPHTFYWVQHNIDENIIAEATRMSGLLGKEISPMKILEQGGWIKGMADAGLSKWYKDSFHPPFIYRTLYNEIRTLWRGHQNIDEMGAVAKFAQKAKFALLAVPTDTAAQYLGNIFLDRPMWQIVPYMATLPLRTLSYAGRGLFNAGPRIASGTYKYQVGKNENQIAWNRLFVEEGLVATAGYKAFLNNLLDKESRGIFPERQDKIEDINDYMFSVLGMNQTVMGEMIAQDVLNAGIAIAEREVGRGRSVREAAKFTAHYLNSAVWMLHRDAWQGNFGVHLRNLTYSRNFTIIPLRVMMILSRITPFASMLKKSGATNFKTASGGGKEAANVMMANDIPERFLPTIAWKFLSVFTGLFFLAFVSKMLLKESLRLMSGREEELPDDSRGAIPMYMQDVNGQELYMDFGFWKMGRDIMDLTSTVIDPVGQMLTGNADFDTGKGAIEWLKGKMGVIFTLQELAGLKNNEDGTPVYDRDDKDFKNAGRFAKKLMELTPINPFIGTAAPKVPFSREPLVDMTLRSLSALSFTIRPQLDQEVKDIKATARSEAFQQREDRADIFTRDQAEQAYREHKISKQTLINKIQEINANQSGHDVNFWKKRDKSILKDAVLRKRLNGD